jgi:hypothetical protein
MDPDIQKHAVKMPLDGLQVNCKMNHISSKRREEGVALDKTRGA